MLVQAISLLVGCFLHLSARTRLLIFSLVCPGATAIAVLYNVLHQLKELNINEWDIVQLHIVIVKG